MKIEIHFKIKVSFRKEYVKAKEGDNICIWWAVDMAHRSYFPVTVLILNVIEKLLRVVSGVPETRRNPREWSVEEIRYDISM